MEPLRSGDPSRIDEYRLLGRLGDGGMGRVYFGKTRGGRPVAVKVINPEFAADSGYLERFRLEAEAAQRVSGAYTAPVLGANPDGRPPWLAIDFVFGPSLDEAVAKGGPLSSAAVWCLAGGLAEALRAVHAQKLVHRDLKPGNVILDASGPKVIDFGIARGLTATGMRSGGLTSPGMTIGTVGYMSPEQSLGSDVGSASDVFSLGCLLVYAATGSPPEAPDTLGVAVRKQPGLAACPADLRHLVEWCLAQGRLDRPTLDQLMTAVEAGRERYSQARGLGFWPEPLDGLVRSEEERIRRGLSPDVDQQQNEQQKTQTSRPRGTLDLATRLAELSVKGSAEDWPDLRRGLKGLHSAEDQARILTVYGRRMLWRVQPETGRALDCLNIAAELGIEDGVLAELIRPPDVLAGHSQGVQAAAGLLLLTVLAVGTQPSPYPRTLEMIAGNVVAATEYVAELSRTGRAGSLLSLLYPPGASRLCQTLRVTLGIDEGTVSSREIRELGEHGIDRVHALLRAASQAKRLEAVLPGFTRWLAAPGERDQRERTYWAEHLARLRPGSSRSQAWLDTALLIVGAAPTALPPAGPLKGKDLGHEWTEPERGSPAR